VQLLKNAKRPVMLVGRGTRDLLHWRRRAALAEALGAKVASDLKTASAFPTDHPQYVGAPSYFLDQVAGQAVREADVILSLDWVDLAGTLRQAFGAEPMTAKIVHASIDHHSHHGWGKEHHALPPIDIALTSAPDEAVADLCEALNINDASLPPAPGDMLPVPLQTAADLDAEISIEGLAAALGVGLKDEVTSFLRLPLGWDGPLWHFRHPLDYLGGDGGGGVGSGPGMAVGAALALMGGSRLPVAVIGDGDFLMAASAVWTAVHYQIPLLVVVANNTSFYNDEVHQERVAKLRGREVQNKWIGQRIADPEVDIAGIARGHGAEGIGPVRTVGKLIEAVQAAAESVRQGKVVVIEARVLPGYSKAMATSLVRAPKA
jgi:thiamine pyrophosphate-dependent acetolactate synthase large subunit-like protein